MKATITVDMDNQAFEDSPETPTGDELARVFRRLSHVVRGYNQLGLLGLGTKTIRDVNGNTIGSLEVTP